MSTPPPPTPRSLADLGPVAQWRAGRLPRRLVQLVGGLALYGVSLAMLVRGALGVSPWDVLHTGLAERWGWTLGSVVVAASFVVLLLWIPLREKPGLGTLANAILVGLTADLTLAVLGQPDQMWLRVLLVLAGVGLNALATALYIGAQFGRGPRDGLMTGLAARTGLSIRSVRTALEVTVVVLGLLLGGTLGPATVLYALGIGPLAQLLLRWCIVTLPAPVPAPVPDAPVAPSRGQQSPGVPQPSMPTGTSPTTEMRSITRRFGK